MASQIGFHTNPFLRKFCPMRFPEGTTKTIQNSRFYAKRFLAFYLKSKPLRLDSRAKTIKTASIKPIP